jgi:predicted dehydrogenase
MFLNRRKFLQDSTLFAAAGVFANQTSEAAPLPTLRKVGANDRIRVACIGYNGQGRTHLRSFASLPDTIVTTVCDVDTTLAEVGIKTVEGIQKKAPKFVQDLRRVLDDKEIDVISIATPNHWHALAAIWAIQAGKDVYVEKPVSHNVSEGRRIVEFARTKGKIVQTGTQSRSNPGMRETIEYVHSGKIGKVTLARGLCYKPRKSIGEKTEAKAPTTVDYNLWLGPAAEQVVTRKRFHYDWHWFWDFGNGDLGNQGIHEMDKARWGLGKKTLCNAVASYGGRLGYVDAGQTANTQVCVFDYGDSELIFEVRGLDTKDQMGARVGNIWYGSEGIVVSTSYNSGFVLNPKGEKIMEFKGEGNHYANFIKAVKSRSHGDLHADIEEGHLSSALCHLGNISYRLGQPYKAGDEKNWSKHAQGTFGRVLEHLKDNKVVGLDGLIVGPVLKFDPKTEQFIDNPTADKQLTRDYRKGFEVPAKV